MTSPSNSGKKLVLSKQTLSTSSSSRPMIHNRFAPLSPGPRPRPPVQTYSSLVQTPLHTANSVQTSPRPSTTQSSSQPESCPYILNPNTQIIKILEDYELQILNESKFFALINYLFPPNCHFFSHDRKTREYYQAILLDTDSIVIEHRLNDQDQSKIDFSKVRILKIVTTEEWSTRPYSNKTLSCFPALPFYNYYDYQQAWFHTFFLRNYTHSWFFYFSDQFSSPFPRWFIKWFQYMGAIPDIFPLAVKNGFDTFKTQFHDSPTPLFEQTMQFVSTFQIPWIMSWTYHYQEANASSPPLLKRHYRVKWWNKFPIDKANIQAVKNYQTKLLAPPNSPTLVTDDDSQIISRLQACSSPQDIRRIINEIRHSPTSSSHDPPTPNPDIDLFQDSQDPYADFLM